jgi:cell fate (sporulation/competence/biofilm development) regulator YlbF (YheA/YmcA/DUF963 family)
LADLERVSLERKTMQEIMQMAERLGQALARTDEFQALRRAVEASGDDRELAELQARIRDLEGELQARLQDGENPTEEQAQEYEACFSNLQANSSYQRLVAAQANFDKIVSKVNETIHLGVQKGAESRIILQ